MSIDDDDDYADDRNGSIINNSNFRRLNSDISHQNVSRWNALKFNMFLE